jgi:glycosyltransferase involved in cell wall biosynthesis
MRVAFFCGALEPWRVGVGEYTRRLANDLQAAGHQVLVIALADPFIDRLVELHQEPGGIAVLRLPKALWQARQLQAVQVALDSFAPDWVSLQLVVYAYDDRGLLGDLGQQLQRLSGAARRHVMFHELWIGAAAHCAVKERLVGWLQRQLLLRALKRWQPLVSHTSNPVYRQLLQREGLQALPLRVPGSIVIERISHRDARAALATRLRLTAEQGGQMIMAGVFGAVHPEWADALVLQRLQLSCAAQGRQLVLLHMGRAGVAGNALWQQLRSTLAGKVPLHSLGELPPRELSEVLRGLDMGLATTPWALAGKSSTIAAMLEHGVPVLVTRNDYQLRGQPTPEPDSHPLLLRYVDALPDVVLQPDDPRRTPGTGTPISSTLLADWSAAT